MFLRIFMVMALTSVICACAGSQSPYTPTQKGSSIARQQAQQVRWERQRKCELMVLASNEPNKSRHIASRCHDSW